MLPRTKVNSQMVGAFDSHIYIYIEGEIDRESSPIVKVYENIPQGKSQFHRSGRKRISPYSSFLPVLMLLPL